MAKSQIKFVPFEKDLLNTDENCVEEIGLESKISDYFKDHILKEIVKKS